MFFINGFTDNKILKEKNIHIWDANTTTQFLKANSKTNLLEDDMGPMYGFQWNSNSRIECSPIDKCFFL